MDVHIDDRAFRLLDVFPPEVKQVNLSQVWDTDYIVAWHIHQHQQDFWLCVKGSFKVGLALTSGVVKWEYLTDKNPRVLAIPPNTWHGFRALQPDSILLYGVTKKWDGSDEERCPVGSFGENWETINK